MALPSTGPISMSQVRSELGLSGSISLGQSEVRALAGRPSGSISMSHLRGKSSWDGSLEDAFGFGSSHSGLAEIRFLANGTIQQLADNNLSTQGRWDGSSASSSNTDIRFTLSTSSGSGTVSPSTGWLALSSTRSVRVSTNQEGINGATNATYLVELRDRNNTGTVVSKSINISATLM